MEDMRLCHRDASSHSHSGRKSFCDFLWYRKIKIGCSSSVLEECRSNIIHSEPTTTLVKANQKQVKTASASQPKKTLQHIFKGLKRCNFEEVDNAECCTMSEGSKSSPLSEDVMSRRVKMHQYTKEIPEVDKPATNDVGLQVGEEQLFSCGDKSPPCNGAAVHSPETHISPDSCRSPRGDSLSSLNSYKKSSAQSPKKSSSHEKGLIFVDEASTSDTGNESQSQTPEHDISLKEVFQQNDNVPPQAISRAVRQRLLSQCHSADNLLPSSVPSSPGSTRSMPDAPPRRKKRSCSHDTMLGFRGRPLSVGNETHFTRPSIIGPEGRPSIISPESGITAGGQFSASTENLARQSLLAAQLLHLIPAHKARERNYLHGRIAANSLLGSVELERVFPSRTVQIFVGTWNMNGQAPPNELNDLLLPEELEHVPDVMAVGTQESFPERSEWEVGIQETIGPSHVLFHSAALGTLHLAIFVRRDLIWFCSVPEESSFSVRPGTAFRTKGAVAIAFMLFGTSFLFITSHLTAHAEKVKERLSDVKRIVRALDLPKTLPCRHKNKDVTQNFDCVFWCGDLNFRLSQPRDEVVNWVEGQQFPLMAPHKMDMDQLTNSISEGAVFRGFEEGPITFKPTYKYDPGTQNFDTSQKQRTPSYTDRILYRVGVCFDPPLYTYGELYKCRHTARRASGLLGTVPMTTPTGAPFLECVKYSSVQSVCTSDHKPVWGLFRSHVRPGIDTIPLAAGLFNREVYLEGIKRRAAAMDKREGASTVCSVQ